MVVSSLPLFVLLKEQKILRYENPWNNPCFARKTILDVKSFCGVSISKFLLCGSMPEWQRGPVAAILTNTNKNHFNASDMISSGYPGILLFHLTLAAICSYNCTIFRGLISFPKHKNVFKNMRLDSNIE